jgi:ligand-binding sensor domain-containing protein
MQMPPDEWQGRPVQAITLAQDGAVWAATEGAGLYRMAGDSWLNFGTSAGLSNLFTWTVMEDSRQQIWAGTWGGGLFRKEGAEAAQQEKHLILGAFAVRGEFAGCIGRVSDDPVVNVRRGGGVIPVLELGGRSKTGPIEAARPRRRRTTGQNP